MSRAALYELLLTFALVWGALTVYSLLPQQLEWADWQLEKSEIKQHLLPVPEPTAAPRAVAAVTPDPAVAPAIAITADAAVVAPEQQHPATSSVALALAPDRALARPIDRSPQRILMFGDSMIDELMLRMADYCLENGHQLKPAIWYASTTGQWASQDKLQTLLSQIDPSYVIVVIGSTELTSRGIARRRPAIEAIKRQLAGRPFIWIGPPNWTDDTGINDLIESIVGKDHFFRSAHLQFNRKRDGIHPDRESSARWMDQVASWISQQSAHPILLDPPTQQAARPQARIFSPD